MNFESLIKSVALQCMKPFRNNFIMLNLKEKAKKGVNLNYFIKEDNIGDVLSKVVVDWMLERKNITDSSTKIQHLYAIGSVIDAGIQDATIWGSGILDTNRFSRLFKGRVLDIRAVRGPLTKSILIDRGYIKNNESVPYGDPAILMPLIYTPKIDNLKYKYAFIPHYTVVEKQKEIPNVHIISTKTTNYKRFIDEICSSQFVISTSLHGIILAESYGVPAVLMLVNGNESIFKYYDYYASTGRISPPIVKTVEEGIAFLENNYLSKIDFSEMRKNLIGSFPYDIYSN